MKPLRPVRILCLGLLLLLLTAPSAAPAAPLGDELLAPAVPRPTPRSRPEIVPRPVIFSSRPVLYAARAANGSRMVTVERGDRGDELWLYAFSAVAELPRLLLSSPVRLAAPALNADGSLVAYVDAQDDVKGDIWLLDTTKAGAVPTRLTGRESADDAPVFTVDGSALVYHRQLPGAERRELVRLTLQEKRSELLPITIDAAFPAPAPDGKRWLFVSRSSQRNGNIWLWDSSNGQLTRLTQGGGRDLYPVWETAEDILFTRQTVAGDDAAREMGQIFRIQLRREGEDGFPFLSPLTALSLMAVAPVPAGDHFSFVAGGAGGGQVMTLPVSGEIPDQPTSRDQWGVARIILERQPPDPAHGRLAAARVLARETEPTVEGARAGLALATLMEQARETGSAVEQYDRVARRSVQFPRERALAEIAGLRLKTVQRCNEAVLLQRRQEILAEAERSLKTVADRGGDDARARFQIDMAFLLAGYGGGAADQLSAVARLEAVAALSGAGRPLKAEAAFRRALLLSRLEKGEGAVAALADVALAFDDQEEWADAAITAVVDLISPRDHADIAALSALAERYRTRLPRLAMGAWNRQGDVAYGAGEWTAAKDAYRTVLEKFPVVASATAAARFALAELLYREERYAEAKGLYETEMNEQPEETPLYQLARSAAVRKTVAAGENLYRMGEMAAARSLFLDLIRSDGSSIEAHRGYIKAVAAMGQAGELLALYRKQLASYPEDPVLLYATGLTLTYLPGKGALDEADALIARAADRLPSSEYPPQTRGYIAEIRETVYGERGGLERSLALYRRAWLLNNPLEQPENRANLTLNIGNSAYLLGSKATAWKFYSQRLASRIPFDNVDTELIFQQRSAAAAFQMGEKMAPITGYQRALQLVSERLKPSRSLDLFGRLSRRVTERLFTESMRSKPWERALLEHQAIIAELERLGATPPEAPPSSGWERFSATMTLLLERQRGLITSAGDWNGAAAVASSTELSSLAAAVATELEAVPRLTETAAEIHDRLALAFFEADKYAAAREQFEAAFTLSRGLGLFGNLAANRRSASIAAYREAEAASGEEQQRLLKASRDGFVQLLELLVVHPPHPKKPAERSGGLLGIAAQLALDKGDTTDAAFGFSAEQEKRLAESYLARILAELGDLKGGGALLKKQLERYPADVGAVAERDLFGVSLLSHRTAHIEYAQGDVARGAADFRRSTELALRAANPVSAMLNLVNWGSLLAGKTEGERADFLALEARVSRLADSLRGRVSSRTVIRYLNDSGALLVRLSQTAPLSGERQALLYKALEKWDRALFAAAESAPGEVTTQRRRQRGTVQLNRAAVLTALGLSETATAAATAALEEARAGGTLSLEWRALATLGRYDEAVALLERLPLTDYDAQQGEVLERFSSVLEARAAKNPEQAFNLLEKLSEIERVQLLGRGALGLDDPATVEQLRVAAPHLVEIDRLAGQLSGATVVEREYLTLRLGQERSVIDDLLGVQRERIPRFYALAGDGAVRLAAASVVYSSLLPDGDPVQRRAAGERLAALQQAFDRECHTAAGRLCRLIVAQSTELIDIQEALPGKKVLRFTPVGDSRWLLFTIAPTGKLSAETVLTSELTERLTVSRPAYAIVEDPSRFPSIPAVSWGVNGAQLVQALAQRKPFRRQVIDPSGWWQGGEPFLKLPSVPVTGRIADGQTLVLPGRFGLLPKVPSRSGGGGYALPEWEDEAGIRHSLFELVAGENLSLVVAPAGGGAASALSAQLVTLLGVPSLLVHSAGGAGDSAPFVHAYGSSSLADAGSLLAPGWLLIGDRGVDGAEAVRLGKSRFADYAKGGVKAHNAGSYQRALSLFENALTIVAENPTLAKQASTLHRYGRESAFSAGLLERAIFHGEAVVKGMALEKPYSADHADALLRLGLLLGNAERFTEAAAALKEGVGMFADLGLVKEQASALADFGIVMENSVNFTAARSLFEDAATLRQTLKDDDSLAEQYRNIGRIYDLRLNQYVVAEQQYARAGVLYARLGNTGLEAETLLERGRCQRLLGNFTAADQFYREALAKVGDATPRTTMRILLEQANNAWFQGRYQEAFDLRERVEKRATAEKWPLEQVMAKNSGGLIWWTLGDNKRAMTELRGALEQAEQLAVRRDEVATTLNNMGLVQRESGDYTAAVTTLERALAIDRQLGSRWALAYDLRNLGQTRLKMGDPTAAVAQFSEAASLATAIGDKVNGAKILLARGDAEMALQQMTAAETSYRGALESADQLLLREVRWRALYGLARVQKGAGHTETAVQLYRQALDTVEDLRAEIKLDQLKDGFLADKMAVYGELVGVLVELNRPDEAFAVAERSRSRNLIDMLGRQRLSLAGSVDQELYDRQLRLKNELLEQETLLLQATNPKEKQRYEQALERLRGAYQDLLIDLERKRPELLALVKVKPTTLAEIKAQLEPGVVLLSYYQLPNCLLVWRIERERSTLSVQPVTASQLSTKIASYRRMLQNLEPLEKQSRELYELLIGSQLSDGTAYRSVGIIPHGSLHYLSFATLHDGKDYLVDRQKLFYLPAASVLKYTMGRRSAERKRHVLAIGNPDLGNSTLDLPFAEREAGTIHWNYPDVTFLTRERATESWVREHISEFGVIHLASHGEFDPLNPLFSAVRLAKDDKADGRLQADEIFGLDIRADLVVLSACQTGLGDIKSGDDVVGMNRAFMFAGTHALISSLWRVSDVSTAILMKQFYRNFLASGTAESLAKAMQQVKNRYPHPGYWGAFVLTGDYK